MTVNQLIKELQKYPSDVEVIFSCSIESGRSLDTCANGDMSLDRDNNYEYYDDETGETHELGDRVILDVSGECTSSQ